jgi:methionyl aminopeptidase
MLFFHLPRLAVIKKRRIYTTTALWPQRKQQKPFIKVFCADAKDLLKQDPSFDVMAIIIKTQKDLEKLRVAGQLAAEVLVEIAPFVKAGVTTGELNARMAEHMHQQGTSSATLGYHGFPAESCISVNDVVCHGIPDEGKKLKNGDIVNIDVTVIKDGYHGDNSMMFEVGKVKPFAHRLCRVAHECLWLGIEAVKPDATLYDIAQAIETHAHNNDFSVVEEYCGHGIGQAFHEEPQVVHCTQPDLKNTVLKEGMVFTIEPMINQGSAAIKTLGPNKKHPDNTIFPVKTVDRKLSAQWEHTIAVTADGYEVLTLRPGEKPVLP